METLRDCICQSDGFALPFALRHKRYLTLDRLLQKGTLRDFIERHPEFEIVELDGRKWGFQFRTPETHGSSSSADAMSLQLAIADAHEKTEGS